MKTTIRLLAAAAAALSLSGCISTKSFIDPTMPRVGYDDVKRAGEPLRLRLVVQFQRNGAPFPGADPTLRENAERVLLASGVIVPDPQAAGEIRVVVNNIADLAQARRRGFGTGASLGIAGNTVTDAYEMSVTISRGGKVAQREGIKHALHTAIGNVSLPPNLETTDLANGFARVFEQMMLRALTDLQRSGELSYSSPFHFARVLSCSALLASATAGNSLMWSQGRQASITALALNGAS
jgi:hypothetical protein